MTNNLTALTQRQGAGAVDAYRAISIVVSAGDKMTKSAEQKMQVYGGEG
jgi:hypothetical protein